MNPFTYIIKTIKEKLRDIKASKYANKIEFILNSKPAIINTSIDTIQQLSNIDFLMLQQIIHNKKIKWLEIQISTLKLNHEKTIEKYRKENKLLYVEPIAKNLQDSETRIKAYEKALKEEQSKEKTNSKKLQTLLEQAP